MLHLVITSCLHVCGIAKSDAVIFLENEFREIGNV
jgi:hypothetical protein